MDNTQKTPKRQRWLIALIVLVTLSVTGLFAVTSVTAGPPKLAISATELGATPPAQEPVLRVMSLNLAHGRANGRNQLLQSTTAIRANLDSVSALLRREAPHVVALQEADGPSFWSGRFDHVSHIGADAGFHCCARGANVDGLGLSYGSGLLSQLPLHDATAYSFPATPPTFTKGYILATLKWQEQDIDVVSLHLDFARASRRTEQIDSLVRELRDRPALRIVMGDFNCDWAGDEDNLRHTAEALDLHTWEPDVEHITFPTTNARLDWILASPQLEFRRHVVLADVVSDHLPVLAEFALQ